MKLPEPAAAITALRWMRRCWREGASEVEAGIYDTDGAAVREWMRIVDDILEQPHEDNGFYGRAAARQALRINELEKQFAQKEAAMRQALEALKPIHHGNMTPMAEFAWDAAIKALENQLHPSQAAQPATAHTHQR